MDSEVLHSAEALVQDLQTIKYNHPGMCLTREEASVLLTKISSHGYSSIYLQAMSNLKNISGDFIPFLIDHFQEMAGNLRTKLEYKKLYSANTCEESCTSEATGVEPALTSCREPDPPPLPITRNCKFCKTLNKDDRHPMHTCNAIKDYLEGTLRIPENFCLICFNFKSEDCYQGRARCTMLRSKQKYCVKHQEGNVKCNIFVCKVCAKSRGIRVAFVTHGTGTLDASWDNDKESYPTEDRSLVHVLSDESFGGPWSVDNMDHWHQTVEDSFSNDW